MPPDQETPQIERAPWSALGPDFVRIWGYADPSDPQPEDVEIVGMKGSGKTHFMLTIIQERAIVRDTAEVLIVTKQHDDIFGRLDWPVVHDAREARNFRKHRQVIFWPRTSKLGAERRAYQEAQVREFLERSWVRIGRDRGGHTLQSVIAMDEVAYIESLSPEVRELVGMYWREARSMGINLVAMKQRPQGVQRDMHSETPWTVAFVPKDEADKERFAELFGPRKIWMPVFDQMDPDRHEFLIRHSRTRAAYISWVDNPIPVLSKREKS